MLRAASGACDAGEPSLRTFIVVVVTIALTLGGVFGFRWWRAKKTGPGAAVASKVRVEKVVRGDLAELVQAPGEIQARTKVSISARVAARIKELPCPEGTTVTKGDPDTSPPVEASVLVRLDDTDLDASLRSAQARYSAQLAQVEGSKARIAAQRSQITGTSVSLANTRREMARERDLLKTQYTSESQYEEAKRRVEEMEAQLAGQLHSLDGDEASARAAAHNLEAAGAEITRAKEALSYATITSPIDGIVTRVNSKAGELAVTGTMNNPGTVILEVADLSQMLFVARVPEANIAKVKLGQKAVIRAQAYADRAFEGTVTSVALAPTVAKDRDNEKNFTAEITIKPDGSSVLSGLTADADIETSRHLGVLKVPSQAVLGRPADDLPAAIREKIPEEERLKSVVAVVYRFGDGKAVAQPVTVGPSDVTDTVIRSGLSENDRVITGPYKVLEKLAHDQKVEEEATSATATVKGAKDTVTTATGK
jgi:HlyD family secretion protein